MRASDELSDLRDAHQTLRARARHEPFDLGLEHERHDDFLAATPCVRRMITVTATIEQMSSGHMKMPPRVRKLKIALDRVG